MREKGEKNKIIGGIRQKPTLTTLEKVHNGKWIINNQGGGRSREDGNKFLRYTSFHWFEKEKKNEKMKKRRTDPPDYTISSIIELAGLRNKVLTVCVRFCQRFWSACAQLVFIRTKGLCGDTVCLPFSLVNLLVKSFKRASLDNVSGHRLQWP